MKWWTWLWIGMIAWVTLGGAWDDRRDHRPAVGIGLGLASGLVCISSVLAFSLEAMAVTLGRWLLPLSVLAGVELATDAIRDVRALSPDPELTARKNRAIEVFGIVAVVLVFGAAVVVGIATGIQRW